MPRGVYEHKGMPLSEETKKKIGLANSKANRGKPAHNRKLNEITIDGLRHRYARGTCMRDLAKRYNVSITTIWRVVQNIYYRESPISQSNRERFAINNP